MKRDYHHFPARIPVTNTNARDYAYFPPRKRFLSLPDAHRRAWGDRTRHAA